MLQSKSDKPLLVGSCDYGASWIKDYNRKSLEAHNLQRPETVESLSLMWRITKDPIYREWGWQIFKAFLEHPTVGFEEGFSSLNDVNQIPLPRRDDMKSFWPVSRMLASTSGFSLISPDRPKR